ncbi:MAG: DNA-formamidopyrimidine glycosylase [Anaeroplasmataceae bacterium]|nr:DNA-formamidopyrimidine glycosylase [Anaeroplasmataceae bacterium]
MPELPEVEVVRQVLHQNIVGKRIQKIECFYPPIIENELSEFITHLENQRITDIKRYAKYLIFIFDTGAMISHLRMEGKYFYVKEEQDIMPHVHVVFHLDNQYKLFYQDTRKFGRMLYKPISEVYTTLPILKIGVEANSSLYNLRELHQKIQKKKISIKEILLDQTIISGLGNIYVDEVLYACGISPLRKGNELQEEDVFNIMQKSTEILNKAIALKGTTIRTYTSSLGVEGGFQNFLQVHTKINCPKCDGLLSKIKIGGRTSYYCSKCQR